MKPTKLSVPVSVMAALLFVGCATYDPDGVRSKMRSLVRENKFDQARALTVQRDPTHLKKSPEEIAKDEMIETLVNPEEARYIAKRVKMIKDEVLARLQNKNDDAARQYLVDEAGVVKQSRVDPAVFAYKCAFLNSRVNPATLKRYEGFIKNEIEPLIAKGAFREAYKKTEMLRPVLAYSDKIDPALDEAGKYATGQRCEKASVEELVGQVKDLLNGELATREGREIDEDFKPDWGKVRKSLFVVREALVRDDVPLETADGIIDDMMNGFKSLVNYNATPDSLTTAELNEAILGLRNSVRGSISSAVAKAAAEETSEKAEAYRKFRQEMVRRAAEEVDFKAREGAFIAAIQPFSEKDSDMIRVLGDAARVLRLYAAGAKVPKNAANSLLVASVLMGFDDTMTLSMALGADLNGASPKDNLARSPYLVALQFGFKGQAKTFLSKASHTVCDANGHSALHYGVWTSNPFVLADLLNEGLDAQAASADGRTPLMEAVVRNQGPMVQQLLPFSNVNAADSEGWTAMLLACLKGDVNMVKMFLSAKASRFAKTNNGFGMLECAIESNSYELLAYLLDEVKISPTAESVQLCVMDNKVFPLRMLVEKGASPTNRDLAQGATLGCLDVVRFLVSIGLDVNSPEVHEADKNADVTAFLETQGYRK